MVGFHWLPPVDPLGSSHAECTGIGGGSEVIANAVESDS